MPAKQQDLHWLQTELGKDKQMAEPTLLGLGLTKN